MKGQTMTRSRCSQVTVVLVLFLFGLLCGNARATPFSQSIVQESSFFTDTGTVSSSVVVGGNSANSFINPITETMRAFVASDGSAFSVRAQSAHAADWCDAGANC